MDFTKSEEEIVSDKEAGYGQEWKLDEEFPDDLESKYGINGNYICVDCGCTFANEDCLSAHIRSKHYEHKPRKDTRQFKSLSNAKEKLISQDVDGDDKNISNFEVSNSEDESCDEFNCEGSDSRSASECDEIDARVWQEELPEAPSPPPDRFPFNELKHTGVVPREGSPLDYFNLFFTDELIQGIVDETNCYAFQKLGTAFNDTYSNEIRIFLALTMLQDIIIKPNSSLYWSKNPFMETPFFRQRMTQKRFSLLKRYLRFSNDHTYGPDSHPQHELNKILYVFDYLRNKFSSLYTLPRDVTIVESLKFWKERLGWDKFISLKKSQSGIKLYMLCDSKNGYVWDIIIYAGKGTAINEAYSDLPVSSRIVMSLMNPLLGKGYCLTTDEWYTSPHLADLLIEHQTDTYGTVKQTRKGIPSQLKTKILKQKGEFCAFRRGKVVLMKWKYKKEVALLSTVHSSEVIQKGRFYQPNFCMPQVVKDYNCAMGEADHADQSLTSNTDKNYLRKIFFRYVEIVVWNSFIIYSNNGQNKKPLDFRMELIDLLVATYRSPDLKLRGRPNKCDTPLRLTGRHFPSYVPNTAKSNRPERICVVCSRKRDAKGKKIRRRTRYECRNCNVGLCVDPCFEIYHTKDEL